MKKNNKKNSILRSSAAEYLTFITASGEGGVEAIYADENVWLTQKMTGVLYNIDTRTVNYHLKKIFSDNELEEDSVIRNFRITAADGKTYDTKHYNRKAIIAVGYKVNSTRAVLFRVRSSLLRKKKRKPYRHSNHKVFFTWWTIGGFTAFAAQNLPPCAFLKRLGPRP